MSGYTRQQSYIDGDVILAEHTNDEFDLIEEAFSASLGHKHDGTAAEGPTIDLLLDNDADTGIEVERTADVDTIFLKTATVDRMSIGPTGDITAISNAIFNGTVDMNSTVTVDGSTTFSTRPAFNGGTTGVDSPFTVDSTFLVTDLNADLLDGVQGASYARSDVADTISGLHTHTAIPAFNGGTSGVSAPLTVDSTFLVTNLNADQVDGLHGTQFMRNDADSTTTGFIKTTSDLFVERNGLQYIKIDQDDTFATSGAISSFSASSNAKKFIINSTTDISNTTPTAGSTGISFYTLGTEKVTILENGNVGIGQVNPSDALVIGNSGKIRVEGSTSGYTFLTTALTTGGSSLSASNGVDTTTFIDFNAPDISTAPINYRFGRATTTTGECAIQLYAHNGTANAALSLSNNGTILAGAGASSILKLGTGTTEKMRIDSSGNVGIGNTSPVVRLVVEKTGSGVQDVALFTSGTSSTLGNAARLYLSSNPTIARGVFLEGINTGGSNNAHDLVFGTNTASASPVERMRITSTGNVGINTTSPNGLVHAKDGRLEVENSGIGFATIETAKDLGILLTSGGMSTTSKYTAPLMFGSHDPDIGASDGPLCYIAGKAEQTYGGPTSVGMGMDFFVNPTTSGLSPSLALSLRQSGNAQFVDGSATSPAVSFINDSDSGVYSVSNGILGFSTQAVERMRIDSSGNLLVGTSLVALENSATTSGIKLESPTGSRLVVAQNGGSSFISNIVNYVSGTATHFQVRENGTARGSISSNGSTTAYNTTSDYRLKEHVTFLKGATERIQELHPYRFNFIGQEQTVDGFIAHEVQAIVPEAVTGEKDGEEMQMMDASKLIPLLTAALKESITKIEALEERITALEGAQ